MGPCVVIGSSRLVLGSSGQFLMVLGSSGKFSVVLGGTV